MSLVNTELQIIQSVCGQDTCCRHPTLSWLLLDYLDNLQREQSVDYFVIFHSDFIFGCCCRFGNSIAVGGQWIEYFDEIEIVQRIHSRPLNQNIKSYNKTKANYFLRDTIIKYIKSTVISNKVDSTNRCEALKEVMYLNYV